MNVARFVGGRRLSWEELEGLAQEAGRRPERLGPVRIRRLGALYRAAAADLAYARRSFPGDPVVAQLETLVARTRNLVYDAPTRRLSALTFFGRDYWRLLLSRPLPLLLSALFLFGPWTLTAFWAIRDPGAAGGLAPREYHAVTEPRPEGADLELSPSEQAAFASQVFTNNIQVSLLAFAGGIALGVGTALVLVFNGALLGTVTGLAIGAGNARPFFELVTAHGVLELTCIVIAGAAGLRLGWALVEPGRRTRAAAVTDEARHAVLLVLGTAPWLVLAGIVEGTITPAGLGLPVVIAVGTALGILFWGLALWLGYVRPRHELVAKPS